MYRNKVSLFTREWIEIKKHAPRYGERHASPSLRGSGLKLLSYRQHGDDVAASPSLRGSGLKFYNGRLKNGKRKRLPLYEGVDWNVDYILYHFLNFNVSLFTREWIEIKISLFVKCRQPRLPLYEGVDWNMLEFAYCQLNLVSLFTREWIEMEIDALRDKARESLPLYEGVDWNWYFACYSGLSEVSLFTREWIEIAFDSVTNKQRMASPSLRGSGLKCVLSAHRETMDLSPSLRGSGLKYRSTHPLLQWQSLPLYEGVDWNCVGMLTNARTASVSLFTREWIEMRFHPYHCTLKSSPSLRGSGLKFPPLPQRGSPSKRLPLYEGVDWNDHRNQFICHKCESPSLRGSGLKFRRRYRSSSVKHVSLFTREWIEILVGDSC